MIRQGGFVARPVRLTFLGPVFCALFLAVVGAQQKPSPSQADSVPTFRSQARVVLVDVIVSDKKGQFVPGLKAEDFTVEEDHKPQRISGFNVHRYEAPARRATGGFVWARSLAERSTTVSVADYNTHCWTGLCIRRWWACGASQPSVFSKEATLGLLAAPKRSRCTEL
jgi:hypothetical protein